MAGKTSNLAGRSLLTLVDWSEAEMLSLLDLADELKRERVAGKRGDRLAGKNVAMVFEKSSTRTRCATAVAVRDEGGSAEYLSSHDSHLGKKESVKDTARVLGRMFDGILYRGYGQETVELLAEHAGIPVWNGLTDEFHPTQALADLMTVRECFGKLKGLKMVYVGDGRNNVANSLMLACVKAGMGFVNCSPPELQPLPELVEKAQKAAAESGGEIKVSDDPVDAVQGANVVCTDVWVSMGEESKRDERIRLLKPYQVNMELMQQTGNLQSGEVIFLHCLPAFHDHNTELTRSEGALEVTDDVFESSASKVFDEAENRMHTIKAMIIATMT